LSTDIQFLDEPSRGDSSFEINPGDYVHVKVTDTGKGMDAETLQHVFEPFYTTKDQGQGTGLGLASVYGSVKNHQGAVFISSVQGEGTAVDLYLPHLDENDRTIHSKTRPTKLAKRFNAKVMLVEEEPLMLDVTQRLLKQLGCRTVSLRRGQEAIEYYRDAFQEIDAVIMDLMMPDSDGEEAYIRMKEINPEIRALIISGDSGEGSIQSLLDRGASYLKKPFRASEFVEAMAQVLPESAVLGMS
jgi:CheY-like chemotaxis protein